MQAQSRSRSRGRSRRRSNSRNRHVRQRNHSHSSRRSSSSRGRHHHVRNARSRSRRHKSRSRQRERPRTIPSNQLPIFDPEEGASRQFCDHLKRLTKMHGESSVIAALPSLFTKGRAKAWFASNTMDSEEISSIDG